MLCNAWLQWPDKKIIVLGADDAPAEVLKDWRILPVIDGTNVETVTDLIKEAFDV